MTWREDEAVAARGLGRVERKALRAVAVQFFVNGAIVAAFVPRLPEIRDRVGIDVATVGMILAAAGALGLVGSASVARLIERFGTRRVLIGGSIVQVSALPIIGFASGPWVLLIGLGLVYMFDVLVDVAMNIQGSYLSSLRRHPVMNRLHGLWSLGTVVGGLVSFQLVRSGVSVTAQLGAIAIFLMIALLLVSHGLLRSDPGSTTQVGPPSEELGPADSYSVKGRGWHVLFLFGLAGMFAVTLETVTGDWAAFRLTDDLGVTLDAAAMGFVAFSGGMMVGRFGGDRVQMIVDSPGLLRLAGVATIVGLVGASLIPNPAVAFAGYALAGLGVATLIPQLYDHAAKQAGRTGAGLGALTAGIRLATLVAPAVVGALAGTSLSVGNAVAIVTIPCALGFLLVANRLLAKKLPR